MSLQALNIEITMFERFSVRINGVDVTPNGICREFLALILAHKGDEVTAKDYWFYVFKKQKIPFSGSQFTRAHTELKRYLKKYQAEEILIFSIGPVRACSIDCDKVSCDYYNMLDGKGAIGDKKRFLPEYEWAEELYSEFW